MKANDFSRHWRSRPSVALSSYGGHGKSKTLHLVVHGGWSSGFDSLTILSPSKGRATAWRTQTSEGSVQNSRASCPNPFARSPEGRLPRRPCNPELGLGLSRLIWKSALRFRPNNRHPDLGNNPLRLLPSSTLCRTDCTPLERMTTLTLARLLRLPAIRLLLA